MTAKREVLQWAEERLRNEGIADWKTDSFFLYENVTGEDRTHFLMNSQEAMHEDEQEKYKKLVEQRCSRIPIQYLTGEQEFMGYSFYVNKHVLIPRMDTEVLVLEVEKHVNVRQRKAAIAPECGHNEQEPWGCERLLDMCTGSGCIAISLKKRNPGLHVTGADISQQALEVAYKNSKNLDADVHFLKSDLFGNLQQNIKFDYIVSNPPYIPSKAVDGLEKEVRCHEPRLALDGTADGLEFYRRITKECPPFLKPGGMLFYEIGHDQGEAVCDIMEQAGFVNIEVVKDLAGLDRVVYGGNKHV